MDVVVKLLTETNFTYQQVVELIHKSFEERLHQGLCFTCSFMTVNQFETKVKDAYIFVAYDLDSEKMLGTVTLHIRKDNNEIVYGYHEFLAVSPEVKHIGVASKLQKELVLLLLSRDGKYEMSDTACGATSSVNWHLKNGFHMTA